MQAYRSVPGRPVFRLGVVAVIVLALAAALLVPATSLAQASAATQLTGSLGTGTQPVGRYELYVSFSCTYASGESGPCTGTISFRERDETCSNSYSNSGTMRLTGLDLSRIGPYQATLTVTLNLYMFHRQPDGSCVYDIGPLFTGDVSISGSWNGTTGTIAFPPETDSNGNPVVITGSFTAVRNAPAPVFPMTVTSSIDPVRASATAAIQFRPQDVGTSGSIFAFAVAPSTLVKGGTAKDATIVGYGLADGKADPPTCVLAQVNSAGQLVAVTASQLQAYSSGTLAAGGASVTLLNNASTPAVAGSTFYVGYGSSSTAMVQNGVYRNAVTVPGSTVCPMFSSQTALWWNRAESGWGLNLNHQGNILFGTLFTYETAGSPMWLVMPAGAMQADGLTFTGDLYRTTGPAFNANPFPPIGASNLTRVGTMTVSFQDVNTATLRYTVNGVEVIKGIERQVFGSRAASCLPSTESRINATNYQDLWWIPAESGWGINVTHQDNTLFATLFTYDASGKGLWLVMSAGTRQADGSYLGELYQTTGPAFNANPFTPIGAGNISTVGTMRFRFANGENGTLTYTYNGAPVTKNVIRQVFSSPLPACN